jgi:hypothetical protein
MAERRNTPQRLRVVAIVLLVAGAAVFAVGTSVEHNRHHDEPAASSDEGEPHDESAESAGQREAEQADANSETAESEEGKILGIDRESTGLVVLAVLTSLALAALLWRRPGAPVWIATGLVALAFAFFDVAELVHQLDESDGGLATLAAVVAAAHLGTAAIAANALRPQRP